MLRPLNTRLFDLSGILAIRLLIGGPPNSGKSTLAESLARALQDQRVDAEAVDLDPWSPTLALIRGEITEEQRRAMKKKEITMEEAEKAAKRFEQISRKHGIALGDAPGEISDQLRIIARKATHAIILCREDSRDAIDKWKIFFTEMGIRIIAVLVSKERGGEEIRSNTLIEGTVSNLDRKPRISPGIGVLATLLRSKLGV